MPFSIVGQGTDARGETAWGVAVASKFLAVGNAVPAAVAGVGALATQAEANVAWKGIGLALLDEGATASVALQRMVEEDDRRDHRQLGMVDGEGGAATYTGTSCLDWAGGIAGPCFAAQGNILVGPETVSALAATFEAAAGQPLAGRLLQCLAAAQAAGGDRRGQQSAALLVVERDGGYANLSDMLVDLRVDDHVDPITELGRLYEAHTLLFGKTPRRDWLELDGDLRVEVEERLRGLGYDGELRDAFTSWAGAANLEERVDGADRIDPVVLAELRAQ